MNAIHIDCAPIQTLAELQALIEQTMESWDEKAKQPSTLPLTPLVRVRTVSGKIIGLSLYYDETEPETVFTELTQKET